MTGICVRTDQMGNPVIHVQSDKMAQQNGSAIVVTDEDGVPLSTASRGSYVIVASGYHVICGISNKEGLCEIEHSQLMLLAPTTPGHDKDVQRFRYEFVRVGTFFAHRIPLENQLMNHAVSVLAAKLYCGYSGSMFERNTKRHRHAKGNRRAKVFIPTVLA